MNGRSVRKTGEPARRPSGHGPPPAGGPAVPPEHRAAPDVLVKLDDVLSRLERMERKLVVGVVRESYTVRQAAERLGLSTWTVRQAANLRRIRAEKARNGRDWRIPHDELMRIEAEGLPPGPD